jgi:hypothetical protein
VRMKERTSGNTPTLGTGSASSNHEFS